MVASLTDNDWKRNPCISEAFTLVKSSFFTRFESRIVERQLRYETKITLPKASKTSHRRHSVAVENAPRAVVRKWYIQGILLLLVSIFVGLLQTFHADWWMDVINNKKGSSVVEIADASHWLMLERPDMVNRQLDAFFTETD